MHDFQVLQQFFPEPVLMQLVELIDCSKHRKQIFSFADPDELPDGLRSAVQIASRQTGILYNYAILKRYSVTDTYRSAAFDRHRDPPDLTSVPLFLATLRGMAHLTVWIEDGSEVVVECSSNTVVVLRPTLEHKVSPPIGEDPMRYLLFLGLRQELTT